MRTYAICLYIARVNCVLHVQSVYCTCEVCIARVNLCMHMK